MPGTVPPSLSLSLTVLRLSQGWSQKELAAVTGIPANLLSDYERGRKTLSRERLEQIAHAMGLPPGSVDATLGFLQSVRAASRTHGPPSPQTWRVEAVAAEASRIASDFARALLNLLGSEARALEARQEAAELWARMKRRRPADRRLLVEQLSEFRSWALCERVCEESVKAAADNADRAVELAELALRIAELSPGDKAWRSRLQGYAWAHVGNARRVRGDLPGAEKAFIRTRELWRVGASADPGVLDEACVLGLEASLRQSQRRLSEALALLDRALTFDKGGLKKHLLLSKARTFEELGDFASAIAVLRQAVPLIQMDAEPRLRFALKLNLGVNLCFLNDYREAAALLPELRDLARGLRNELDLIRLRWLEGRVAAGLGRRQEAIEALSQVRGDFTSRGIAYDAALASLELAVLYLQEGRTAEVKSLARQMAPVFQAQGVPREALAALRLFRGAAEREVASLELAQRLVIYLQRVQHEPGLRFENA